MSPRFLDLRTSDRTQLEPLAPFRVLSVMCHPQDAGARRRMLDLLKSETGAGAVRGGKISNAEFSDHVRGSEGPLAGALLLNLLQLDGNGRRPSLSNATQLVKATLPPWSMPTGPEWHDFDWTGHLPRRRDPLLKAFKDYLSVAHLWGALLHAEEHDRRDIWPGDPATLPRFVAYADAFAAMAAKVRWAGRDRRYLLPSNVPWRFMLPEHLVEHAELHALRLKPEQISALNTPAP